MFKRGEMFKTGKSVAHTPGPWVVAHQPRRPSAFAVHTAVEHSGFPIIICELGNYDNARLLAAAPQLLDEAVKNGQFFDALLKLELPPNVVQMVMERSVRNQSAVDAASV